MLLNLNYCSTLPKCSTCTCNLRKIKKSGLWNIQHVKIKKENEKCAEIKEFLIALETLVKLQNNKE